MFLPGDFPWIWHIPPLFTPFLHTIISILYLCRLVWCLMSLDHMVILWEHFQMKHISIPARIWHKNQFAVCVVCVNFIAESWHVSYVPGHMLLTCSFHLHTAKKVKNKQTTFSPPMSHCHNPKCSLIPSAKHKHAIQPENPPYNTPIAPQSPAAKEWQKVKDSVSLLCFRSTPVRR